MADVEDVEDVLDNNPICVYCAHEHSDYHNDCGSQIEEGKQEEIECDSCGRTFLITQYVEYRYLSEKAPDVVNADKFIINVSIVKFQQKRLEDPGIYHAAWVQKQLEQKYPDASVSVYYDIVNNVSVINDPADAAGDILKWLPKASAEFAKYYYSREDLDYT